MTLLLGELTSDRQRRRLGDDEGEVVVLFAGSELADVGDDALEE